MLKKVLTPESKALLLSCLVGGSTIGLRVAQWVGFGLLAEESVVSLNACIVLKFFY